MNLFCLKRDIYINPAYIVAIRLDIDEGSIVSLSDGSDISTGERLTALLARLRDWDPKEPLTT